MKGVFLYVGVGLSKSVEFYTFHLNKIFSNRYWLYIGILFNFNILNIIEKVGFTNGKFVMQNTMWSPFWLLLGPFCFLANNSLSKNKSTSLKSIHLLPGVLYILIYTVIRFNLMPFISEDLNTWYWLSIFLIPLSLAFYSIYIITDRTRDLTKLEPFSELVVIISCFYLIIALLYFLVGYFELILNIELIINYRYFIYGLSVAITIFIAVYLLVDIKRNSACTKAAHFSVLKNSYSNSKLKTQQIDDYKKRIEEHFEYTKCFLQSNLSLDDLSQELDIPQHNLSQIFNLYLGSNFYGYIAKHRIEYAVEQLKLNKGRLKIEALAYQSGFNSRSSFVRYFKEMTGYNPSEYCQKVGVHNL